MEEMRRLSAIVVADVVGYSRLMGQDESRTLAALRELRATRIDPLVAEYGGRVVKSMGDGLLIEFASVVLAMRFAARLQSLLARPAGSVDEGGSLSLRIGLHEGDVVVDGDDIFGEGVNVAARLEPLAAPGGVCLSQRAYEDVRGRLPLEFVDGGAPALKNIVQPVRVWHWHPNPADASSAARRPLAAATLPLPDRPSIAVLPFDNLGADPEDGHFADGLAEDLITELSRFRELFVIARNSTFAFRGAAVDVQDVGRRLGVQYVVEGSLRRTGRRVRVTAQLIDAATGRHVWAERYDRDLDDVFAAQDELAAAIVAAIAPAVDAHGRERARRVAPARMGAWETLQRGLWHVYRYTPEDNREAIGHFERAIAMDPDFASAHAALGYAHYVGCMWGFATDLPAAARTALASASRAAALDGRDAFARSVNARALMLVGNVQAAIAEATAAVELNVNLAAAHYALGFALAVGGRGDDALAAVDRAIRLSPYDPLMHAFLTLRSAILIVLGRHEEGLATALDAQRQPSCTAWGWLQAAAALANLGRLDEARASVARAREMKPDASMRWVRALFAGGDRDSLKRFLDGLERAGLE